MATAQVKDALLDEVARLAVESAGSLPGVEAASLVRGLYEGVAADDIADLTADELFAAARCLWRVAARRQPGEVVVRVYNPTREDDGWESGHTVVDIVSQDIPFIVDSVLALMESLGIVVDLVAHPVTTVVRSGGEVVSVGSPDPTGDGVAESFMHLQIDRVSGDVGLTELRQAVEAVMGDVASAVRDWPAMVEKARTLARQLHGWAAEADDGRARYQRSIGHGADEVAELLEFIAEGSFTFLGYREYDLIDESKLVARPGTGLGVMSDEPLQTERDLSSPPELKELARQPLVANLTKANSFSTVHRSAPLDYVGIKEINADGVVTGERRFVGLYTADVYNKAVMTVPVIRDKVEEVIRRSGLDGPSHNRSRLLFALNTYPRDELFQMSVDELEEMVAAIVEIRDRRRVNVVLRKDTFGRFLSLLIYAPRDRYTTDVRLAFQSALMEAYGGTKVRFSTELSDAALARVHMVIYREPGAGGNDPSLDAVESMLTELILTWDDGFRSAALQVHGPDEGPSVHARFSSAFPATYRAHASPRQAVGDLERLRALGADDIDVHFTSIAHMVQCHLYRTGGPTTLTRLIPLLHDLGAVVVDERPHLIATDHEILGHVYQLGLDFGSVLKGDDRERLRDTVLAAWRGEGESDRLGEMVLSAGLTWREVAVVRAYARYFVQLGGRYSIAYVIQTLVQHPQIVSGLVDLFSARCDPEQSNDDLAAELTEELLSLIDEVSSLDADRILRAMLSLISATVRTNAWARHDALAFKLDPTIVEDMPKPVPHAEIFVYAPRVEGVHLRAGSVARGGLRWSDRYEDFRTEILGLMKAQSVKNSVIVPVGAKGGFVARRLPTTGDRSATMDEVVGCYKLFISGLLDVTDNLVDGEIVPPDMVRRLDGDDPYLVVAADKGTATFSDIANAIAIERGFWLGDAFASGGSVGYDHKALAITARGAWVSVQRHFEQLDHDVQTQPLTVVGIGDMSGDVFGNGMLRSEAIRLVAAFDHRDIFIDPDPCDEAFAERERLFELPRSSWADYDKSLISEGGGVFSRSAKSIRLPARVRELLGIEPGIEALAPNELLNAILKAPVDLIWNGGIGTYVKASSELHTEVGDRGNDAIRVDGNELRCTVFGEGGNLGVTQEGRIEFAQNGGRINTDAIDNSAGVDCSDHEVNLKILLADASGSGLIDGPERDHFLGTLADEVCDHVLANNDSQNETLTLAEAIAPGMVDVHQRLLHWLQDRAGLDRSLEALPSDDQLTKRREAGRGLTRPELSVLLAYTKNTLTQDLVDSPLVDEPAFEAMLDGYFPDAVVDRFADLIDRHALRRELTGTLVSNVLVNLGGISMVHRLAEETSATIADIARAHTASLQIFDLLERLDNVRALDGLVDAATQTTLKLEIKRLGERATRWLLRHEPLPFDVDDVVARYAGPVASLFEMVEAAEREARVQIAHQLDPSAEPSPEEPTGLERDLAELDRAFGFLELSGVQLITEADLEIVAAISTHVEARFELAWLRQRIADLPRDDHWQTLARGALRDEVYREHAELTSTVVRWAANHDGHFGNPGRMLEEWIDTHDVAVERFEMMLAEIRSAGRLDLAGMSVAIRALNALARTQAKGD